MKKKEKQLTLGLLAAIGMSPLIAKAQEPNVYDWYASKANVATIVAGDVEFGSYSKDQLQWALKIAEGNTVDLSDIQLGEGQKVIDQVEVLRRGAAGDVTIKSGDESSFGLIQSLIQSNNPAFLPDESLAAVIFFQIVR